MQISFTFLIHICLIHRTGGYKRPDLNTSSLKMYWGTLQRFGGEDLWRELLSVVSAVAKKHGVSAANVALKWVMQQVQLGQGGEDA
jgi:aryl-alcohol dehydrogenase-like predicted oxidoreductase